MDERTDQRTDERTQAIPRRRGAEIGAIVVESVGVLLQLWLVAIGIAFILTEDESELLATWCLVGTGYLVLTMLALNVVARHPRLAGRQGARRFLSNPVIRISASVLTFSSTAVGVFAATELLLFRNDPEWGGYIQFFAVWAMLVSWCLFHWGWARIYFARFHRAAGEPPLEFPRTPEPTLIDFVYFAFTNATAFSVSDVVVTSSRMRWTVIWHTTLSFFFNALLIVLAINTILGFELEPAAAG
ncbi:DUF1345 domain-containing protein [Agromyces sp. LHK192]|uniref:DUF1345 domain-containing protein n=1 Tax=Agromyces sp. LHK192 TaxID=2498704 RepID=UPI000FDC0259|nr:DUF1345 domain-containing protein [Agromyces sp. LHK192]